jgi:hypothetical protein
MQDLCAISRKRILCTDQLKVRKMEESYDNYGNVTSSEDEEDDLPTVVDGSPIPVGRRRQEVELPSSHTKTVQAVRKQQFQSFTKPGKLLTNESLKPKMPSFLARGSELSPPEIKPWHP